MNLAEHLPPALVLRASLSGGEYAWPLEDIPNVIEAVREAGLVNVGGQLQFRIPDEMTAEVCVIEVDTYRDVPKTLSWGERVALAAEAAHRQFAGLPGRNVMIAEGRNGFGEALEAAARRGHALEGLLCFVWYAAGPEGA